MLARWLLQSCWMVDHVLVGGCEARHDIHGHVLSCRRLGSVAVPRLPCLLRQHLLGCDFRLRSTEGLRIRPLVRLPLLAARVAILRGRCRQAPGILLRLHQVLLLVDGCQIGGVDGELLAGVVLLRVDQLRAHTLAEASEHGVAIDQWLIRLDSRRVEILCCITAMHLLMQHLVHLDRMQQSRLGFLASCAARSCILLLVLVVERRQSLDLLLWPSDETAATFLHLRLDKDPAGPILDLRDRALLDIVELTARNASAWQDLRRLSLHQIVLVAICLLRL